MHLRTKLALLVVMVMAFLPAAGNAYAGGGGHHATFEVMDAGAVPR